jgi:FkbM family methyltransferase
MKYSQNNEQAVIVRYLGQLPPGRFLDLGAFDGKTYSNTFALAEVGWSGVCVDASPLAFKSLCLNHRDRPGIECVLVAVTPETTGDATLWETADAMSTLIEEGAQKWAPYVAERGGKLEDMFAPVTVACLNVADFSAQYPGPYDFVNIDLEGLSVDVAKLLPFDEFNTRLVCVEHDNQYAKLTKHFADWAVVHYNSENVIFRRRAT